MKVFAAILCLLGTLTFGSTAHATELDWNQFRISYADPNLDIDSSSSSGKGFQVSGNALVTEDIFVTGEFLSTSFGEQGANLDSDFISVGAGFIRHNDERTAMYSTFTYERLEAAAFVPALFQEERKTNGAGVNLGFRHLLNTHLELKAEIGYLLIDDSGVGRYSASAWYRPTSNVAIGLGYRLYLASEIDLEVNVFTAGIEYSF